MPAISKVTRGARVFPRVELKQVVQLVWNTLPVQSPRRDDASPIKYNGLRPHNPAAEATVCNLLSPIVI